MLYVVVKSAYYPTAVFFVHGAYRHFKAFAMYNQKDISILGDYEMMPTGQSMQRSAPTHYPSSTPTANTSTNRGGFMAFQGEGTVIG